MPSSIALIRRAMLFQTDIVKVITQCTLVNEQRYFYITMMGNRQTYGELCNRYHNNGSNFIYSEFAVRSRFNFYGTIQSVWRPLSV